MRDEGPAAFDREGVRRENGNAAEHAGMARRLHNAPTGGRDHHQAPPAAPYPRTVLTIFRTTYSGVLKDNMDYLTTMFDGSGKLVAQGG